MPCLIAIIFVTITGFQAQPRQVPRSDDFRFSFRNVFEPAAENYLVEMVNMKRFREEFYPHAKYYGVDRDNAEARLTYRFTFEKPIAKARFRAIVMTCNFENNKSLGSGQSYGSIWCSTDGRQWVQLLDCPMPRTGVLVENPINQHLPEIFRGQKSIWLQVRMISKNRKDQDYCVAQFCRLDDIPKDFNAPVFDLRVNYQKPASEKKIQTDTRIVERPNP